MNIIVWVVQGLLGLAFLMSGFMKATQPKEKLAQSMGFVNDFSAGTVKTIGTLEVLGGIGVVLPAAIGWATWLTPLAALGLVLTMVGAILTHIRRKEYSMIGINVVLLLLAAFVIYGRYVAVVL